jgi:hypothetical protein
MMLPRRLTRREAEAMAALLRPRLPELVWALSEIMHDADASPGVVKQAASVLLLRFGHNAEAFAVCDPSGKMVRAGVASAMISADRR